MADDLTNTNAYLAAQMSATIQEYMNYANTDIAVYTTPPNGGPFGNGYVVFTTVTNGTIIQPSYPTVIASISNAGADAAVNAANNAAHSANVAMDAANSAIQANADVHAAISNTSGVFAANTSAWAAYALANAAAADAKLANSWAWAAVSNSGGGGGNGGVGAITLTGDITGSGLGTIATTLKNVGVAGTYTQVTTDSKGRVIAGALANGGSALNYTPAHQDQITSFGGDVSGSGAANSTVTLTLNSITTPGVFTKVAVDGKGRVTNGSTMTGTDVTTSLGYTPAHQDQTVTIIGDTTGTGAANAAIATTLANVGTPSTYTKVTTDSKGRVIAGANTTSTDISNTLGYIPAHQDQVLSHTGGDVTGNGVANGSIALFLGAVGTAGTYTKVITDSKGRVTGNAALASGDILPAIGFTPARQDQTITIIGDTTGSGAANTSITTTLANAGVAGTYIKVVTDAKGRVIANASLANTDVNTALGYIPAHQDQTSAYSGDVTGSGAANSTIAITLVNSGVTAGTYSKVTVDSKGRATSGSNIGSTDVTTALGYAPAHNDQTITLVGDTTGSGAANSSITTTLAAVGTAGTYTKVTTDAKGRVTAGAALTTSDVSNALGYAPAHTDQTLTFTGDSTGSGAANSAIALTLVNTAITAGVFNPGGLNALSITADGKGRLTAAQVYPIQFVGDVGSPFAPVSYIVVGGGGGGGFSERPSGHNLLGGGGGAGQVSSGNVNMPIGTYTVVVGTGGSGANVNSTNGTNGGNSALIGLANAIGGGGGGSWNTATGGKGSAGYTGGGSTSANSTPVAGGVGSSGYNGGSGLDDTAGGGGGAAGSGQDHTVGGAAGGAGVNFGTWCGQAVNVLGLGGYGGSSTGTSTQFTGAGSGGNGNGGVLSNNATVTGNAGRDGIVKIGYVTGTMFATGGTITSAGGYTVHTFTSGGTFTVSGQPGTATYVMTLTDTGVTPGTYTSSNITVDSKGRITAAANGTGGSGLPTTGGTMTGVLNLAGYTETVGSPTITANAITINCANTTVFNIAMNSNITTMTIANTPVSGSFGIVLNLTMDGTPRTITWPASVKWPSNNAPVLTSANTKVDVVTLSTTNGGTTWLATAIQNF